jgi:hypothetical protein
MFGVLCQLSVAEIAGAGVWVFGRALVEGETLREDIGLGAQPYREDRKRNVEAHQPFPREWSGSEEDGDTTARSCRCNPNIQVASLSRSRRTCSHVSERCDGHAQHLHDVGGKDHNENQACGAIE